MESSRPGPRKRRLPFGAKWGSEFRRKGFCPSIYCEQIVSQTLRRDACQQVMCCLRACGLSMRRLALSSLRARAQQSEGDPLSLPPRPPAIDQVCPSPIDRRELAHCFCARVPRGSRSRPQSRSSGLGPSDTGTILCPLRGKSDGSARKTAVPAAWATPFGELWSRQSVVNGVRDMLVASRAMFLANSVLENKSAGPSQAIQGRAYSHS